MQFPRRPAFDRKGSLLPNARCKDLSLGTGAHSRLEGDLWSRSLTINGPPPSKELQSEWHDLIDEGRRILLEIRARRPLVKSFLFFSCEMWNVKSEMSGSKSKVKDKNRSILNKEIVEKWKLSIFQKYYLKSNVPSTVDVLRAGK